MANPPHYKKLQDGLEKSETKVTEKSSTSGSDTISTNATSMKRSIEKDAITDEKPQANETNGNVSRQNNTDIRKKSNSKPKRSSSILVSTMDKLVAKVDSEETQFTDESEYTFSSQTGDDETYTQYTQNDDDRTNNLSISDETFNYEGCKVIPIFCGWNSCSGVFLFNKDPDYIFVKQYVTP